jgi:hypothetical protein
VRYLSVEQIKDYARSEIPTADDDFIEAAGNTAEATIDQACQRAFVVASVTPSARVYNVPPGEVIRFHDAVQVVSIGAISSASYRLEPLNGLTWAGEARPYEQARLLSGSWSGSWTASDDDTITITARWGWSAIPDRIVQAALIVAKEIIVNRDEVKLGLIGFSDVGGVTARTNPIVRDAINHYRRVEAWGLG